LWILAGALLGLSVFIHPTAPLYALTAFTAVVLHDHGSIRARVRDAWPGAVALLATFVPYYVKTLHVLSDRYGVGARGISGRTFSRSRPGPGRCVSSSPYCSSPASPASRSATTSTTVRRRSGSASTRSCVPSPTSRRAPSCSGRRERAVRRSRASTTAIRRT